MSLRVSPKDINYHLPEVWFDWTFTFLWILAAYRRHIAASHRAPETVIRPACTKSASKRKIPAGPRSGGLQRCMFANMFTILFCRQYSCMVKRRSLCAGVIYVIKEMRKSFRRRCSISELARMTVWIAPAISRMQMVRTTSPVDKVMYVIHNISTIEATQYLYDRSNTRSLPLDTV